jgi:hypothetical protein
MPSTAGATMSIPPARASVFRIPTVRQSLDRNTIYTFGKKYTRWGGGFPGKFVPVLKIEGKCSLFGSGSTLVIRTHRLLIEEELWSLRKHHHFDGGTYIHRRVSGRNPIKIDCHVEDG